MGSFGMSGKGDAYRPVDRETYESNWDRIFSNKQDREVDMSEEKTVVTMMVLTPKGQESKLRETIERWNEKASQRCPNTIDIEEQIEQDRSLRKSAEVWEMLCGSSLNPYRDIHNFRTVFAEVSGGWRKCCVWFASLRKSSPVYDDIP